MKEHLFDELKRYVDFGERDGELLRGARELVLPHARRICEDFYDHVLRHEDASRVLADPAQVERLKCTLVSWLDQAFAGPWDHDYYELRARIGRRHVQVELPQHYMLTAMNLIRGHVCRLVMEALAAPGETITAVNKLFDLELAIMLHTYREDLIAKMMRTERLAAYGQVAASIAHELRNPLGVMDSSLFILARIVSGDLRGQRHVNRLRDEVDRSNRIISDLLDLVRDQPPDVRPTPARALVKAALAGVREREGVAVKVDLPAELPDLAVDSGQVIRVLTNLIENAYDAIGEGGGEMEISGRLDDERVAIVVNDSGPGIAPELGAKIFEPLVTTKARGIGLGLALCQRLTKENGGSIGLTRGRLSGAAFELRLPARPMV